MQARLVFPVEPYGKGRPRSFVQGGRVILTTPPKTRQEEERIKTLARPQWWGPPWDCAIALRVDAYFTIPRSWTKKRKGEAVGQPHTQKPDGDNILKLLKDSLNGLAWVDDKLIYDSRCIKWWAPTPRLVVALKSFGDNGAPAGGLL